MEQLLSVYQEIKTFAKTLFAFSSGFSFAFFHNEILHHPRGIHKTLHNMTSNTTLRAERRPITSQRKDSCNHRNNPFMPSEIADATPDLSIGFIKIIVNNKRVFFISAPFKSCQVRRTGGERCSPPRTALSGIACRNIDY